MQVPQSPTANLGSSLIGGIKTGEDYARMSSLMDYRQQEIQKGYASIKNQMAEHQIKVMTDIADRWDKIYGADPKIQPILIKRQILRDQSLGYNTQGFADLAKDPNNRIDITQPFKQYIQGLQGKDPDMIAQAADKLKSIGPDSLSLKDMSAQVIGYLKQANTLDIQKQKMNVQQSNKQGDVLTQYQKALNTSEYQKANGVLAQAQTASANIDSAEKGNAVAYNALPIQLANMMTGGQRINAVEINRLGGSKAILDRLTQIGEQMKSGDLTSTNANYMRGLVQTMTKGAESHKFQLEESQAQKYSERTGLSVEDSYQKVVGKPYPDNSDDLTQHANESSDQLPSLDSDKIKGASSKVQDLLKQKIDPSDIKGFLIQKNPNLNDADFKAMGLPNNPIQKPIQAKSPGMQEEVDQSNSGAQLNAPDVSPTEAPTQDQEQQ